MSSLPVLVIGGGIAGVQAALDLAEAGCRVVIVERSPSLGGKMAALDKNFPTLDCSICIEAPKLSEVGENRNIEIMSNAEVVGLDPEETPDGRYYRATIRRKASLVSTECTRCNLCTDSCPVALPNEFDAGMATRKAVYTPFPQAVPGPYFLDIKDCVNDPPIVLPCTRCVDVCPPKCISFDRPLDETLEREVASVIVTTGFETMDPALLTEYGYGKHPDIMTAMEFERLLSSAGPTGGEILRPSDGRHAKRVVFSLCAGSRDERHIPQCSRFCCMYSIKEAFQAKDHGVEEVTVLYMDIRSYGKGFDGFYERAKQEGVKFVRGRGARVRADKDGLNVRFEDTGSGDPREIEADIVVLATGAKPPAGLAELAKTLGIELGTDGFVSDAISAEGIFAAGSATGPKDIPDSVTEAGAAAARAMERVKTREWAELEKGEPLPSEGDAKIGVFICDCGSNIAGVVDVPESVKYAATLSGVVHAEEVRFACAGNTQSDIARKVRELGLNRLVVAACSPKTHEGTFKRVCMKAGLNPYLFEMANLRNHDSWVHKGDKPAATSKALDMVRMAVDKAALLAPLDPYQQPMVQAALVIGGGPAGLSAATNLARQGYEVHLVEKKDRLGGALPYLAHIEPYGIVAQEMLAAMLRDVETSGARIHLSNEVAQIDGHVGNFRARLKDGEVVDAGVVIIATGARMSSGAASDGPLASPAGPKTVTNGDLHHMISAGSVEGERITLVGCVGARTGGRECSRYCCNSMIGQALRLRQMGKKVRVLYRDLRTFGRGAEDLYREAAEAGVSFFRYPDEDPEKVLRIADGSVVFRDEFLGQEVAVPTDLLVLVCGLQPGEDGVSRMLKVSRSSDGFLLERHPKLGPVEAGSPGIYLCGTSQGPKDVRESIMQGLAAAAKASALLSRDVIEKEPLCAVIDEAKCNGCNRCVGVCPFGAIQPFEGPQGKKVRAITAACAGCGTCSAECYRDAITMPYFTDSQIEAQIDAALTDEPASKVVVFACNWCSYAGADQAGVEKIQYPAVARIVRTMCSGRIRDDFVQRAFEKGAGAVLVTGCHPGDCHYINANQWTEKRFGLWRKKAERKGVSADRLQLEWISAAEGKEFAAKMKEMASVLQKFNGGRKVPQAAEMQADGGSVEEGRGRDG